ncbi:DNA-binding GntR family transcriptional regulator [Rhizobium leguminosarum]|uniref:DNA-binding GntR family transcriptional regulator n=1 Tax=Rhizobium leguminosarum TaxID=384 RepID=A0AAE2SXZ5_RHILE|nr:MULTISPECIES: GntR family transcriptional regulator [Rhizobium]MBB4292421.1 DNA-binding GntR family transcriptional regulator [Rhizobium leguminosarum]MBB4298659.1 DNA-binding GntR family transcriptional regulator [Rhizobium leguminosarum]MBB4310367.1 DNA-binding GntR family transcriptional regulator [Rhizobium leguminosarum]MBB4434629.1 DNA-binding GntR family transcriptional regulator [Rhizobium esperanzae]MBB4531525.1 DNA-binding GntR family transcriptional regulator [Rhizobium leguminos
MDETDEQPTLREKAYASFTRHLLARDVRPGQFVSQRRLVELTGLTLGAIRELIPRLEAEGLIKTVPQRGLQIAHIDLNLIREAFQLRVFLEKEAVALFTRSASDETIAGLLKQHRDIADAIRSGDASHELELHAQAVDWGMHDAFIDALGNTIISNAYRVNSIKMRLISQDRFRIEGHVGPVMDEHLKVLEAIERRSAEDAVSSLVAHINGARDRALRI